MDFQTAYNLVVPVAEKKYGVEVMISDVVNPNTGDFDGQTILINHNQDLEVALPEVHAAQVRVALEFLSYQSPFLEVGLARELPPQRVRTQPERDLATTQF